MGRDLTGTLRIEQSDFKNEDLQFAYGAIDCVPWTVEKPASKNWRKNPATRMKIEMRDYYEFHRARPGVSQCAHAACVELVARSTAKNFWTAPKPTPRCTTLWSPLQRLNI